ncbi:MAG: DUF58 domain-containing protein [Chloroflexi bacterium]|nr:DUF58 domain-containing protein [Chloroflexota bacterium]
MGNAWVYVAIGLAVLSALLASIALLLVAILILILTAVTRLWVKYCLARVEYRHALSAYRAFTGEELSFTTELTNNKLLPMPWVQVRDEVPRYAAPLQGRLIVAPVHDRLILSTLVSMSWYHKLTRRYSILCQRRGHYYLGPVYIRSGDPFGMFSREIQLERDHLLSVFPRVLPLVLGRMPSREPYGNVRLRRSLIDDLTRPMGSREYVAGDSIRHIHWKSTARTGRLQTRVFDASTAPNYVVFYDVRTVEPPLQGSRPHLLELGVLATTALANHALENDHPVGVYVNQTSRLTSRLLQVPPSSNPEQIIKILEIMAQVHPEESISLANLLAERTKTLPWGVTILVVAAVLDEGSLTTIIRLRQAGRSIALVKIGSDDGIAAARRIPTYTVSEANNWERMEEVVLT